MSSIKITSLIAIALVCSAAADDYNEDYDYGNESAGCKICRSYVGQLAKTNINDYSYDFYQIFEDFCRPPFCYEPDRKQCRYELQTFREIFTTLTPEQSCDALGFCESPNYEKFLSVAMGPVGFNRAPVGSMARKIVDGAKWQPDLHPLCDACEHAVDFLKNNREEIEGGELLKFICSNTDEEEQCNKLGIEFLDKLQQDDSKQICAGNGLC